MTPPTSLFSIGNVTKYARVLFLFTSVDTTFSTTDEFLRAKYAEHQHENIIVLPATFWPRTLHFFSDWTWNKNQTLLPLRSQFHKAGVMRHTKTRLDLSVSLGQKTTLTFPSFRCSRSPLALVQRKSHKIPQNEVRTEVCTICMEEKLRSSTGITTKVLHVKLQILRTTDIDLRQNAVNWSCWPPLMRMRSGEQSECVKLKCLLSEHWNKANKNRQEKNELLDEKNN